MLKSYAKIRKQNKEKIHVPRTAQQTIPIDTVYEDGIFRMGTRYSKTYRFVDINLSLIHIFVVDAIYDRIIEAEIWIPYKEIRYQYIKKKTKLINKLTKKINQTNSSNTDHISDSI